MNTSSMALRLKPLFFERLWVRRTCFYCGLLAPFGATVFLPRETPGAAICEIGLWLVGLFFLYATLSRFDQDYWRFGLRFRQFIGVALKLNAIAHVVGGIFAAYLALGSLSSVGYGIPIWADSPSGIVLCAVAAVWMYGLAALLYLTGDGYMRAAARDRAATVKAAAGSPQ